jgi:hypothetical protein
MVAHHPARAILQGVFILRVGRSSGTIEVLELLERVKGIEPSS